MIEIAIVNSCLLWQVVSAADLTTEPKVWSQYDSNGVSECGSDLNHAILCSDDQLQLEACYCLYYDHTLNTTIAGSCMGTCYSVTFDYYHHLQRFPVRNASEFNSAMCGVNTSYVQTNREGRFCGKCKEGYGLAAYSYHYTTCVPCSEYSYKNWLRYFTVAFLPLTVHFLLVVLFRVSATSSRLNGPVFMIQCICSPIQLRLLDGFLYALDRGHTYTKYKGSSTFANILTGLASLVNLDFFRTLYPYSCLHPSLNRLHIISLDFAVALYPFLLIFLTYLLVVMYDKDFRIVVWAWKPFKWCLRHYHSKFDTRSSLVEAFASFLLLSNVKLLSVCFDLLVFTQAYHSSGEPLKGKFYYYDASLDYFGPEHLPFAILALCVGFLFVILPFTLLLVYPCPCFQKCLNFSGYTCRTLHVFMDAFQGSYKTAPRDLRFFSAYYLLLRFVIMCVAGMVESPSSLYLCAYIMITAAIIFAVFRPYKTNTHNIMDVVCLLLVGLMAVGVAFIVFGKLDHLLRRAANVLLGCTILCVVLLAAAAFFGKVLCKLFCFGVKWFVKKVRPARGGEDLSSFVASLKRPGRL